MTDDLTVSPHETGVVRIFALNLPEADIAPFRRGDCDRIGAVLGLDVVDHDFVETLKIEDLQPIGLAGYLTEGIGLPPEAILADRGKLDALGGHVLLVHSNAFGRREAALVPTAEVTYIGTYREPQVLPSFDPLTSGSAEGTLEGPADASTPPARNRGLKLAMAVLVVLALIALLFITG